jgi:hypothetical protein
MREPTTINKSYNTFAIILYVCAGLAAAIGVLLLVVMISSASGLPGLEMFFQLAGIGQLAGLVLNPLKSALINLGILLFFLMLAIGVLLFATGKLVARQASLSERVARLEEKLGI